MESLSRAAAWLPGVACGRILVAVSSQCREFVDSKGQMKAELRPRAANAIQAFAAAFLAASSPLPAMALDYEQLIQQGAEVSSKVAENVDAAAADGLDFDSVGSVLGFVSDNPAAIVGGGLAVTVPLVVSRVIAGGKAQSFGLVSASDAFGKLGDPAFGLLDIRSSSDIKSEGSPDLKQLKKRPFQCVYTGDDDDGFVQKVKSKFKDAENTTLYILDRFDGNSLKVAKLLATNGFKAAYAIRDGSEGPRGWQKSELPWLVPKKGFSLNLGSLTDVLPEGDVVPATLGVAAAVGAGVLIFTEAETALQLVGTAALLQIFVKKLLFAEDRKKTLKDIQTFLDTKIAPKEVVDDLKAALPNPMLNRTVAAGMKEPYPATGAVLKPEAPVSPIQLTPSTIASDIEQEEKKVQKPALTNDKPTSEDNDKAQDGKPTPAAKDGNNENTNNNKPATPRAEEKPSQLSTETDEQKKAEVPDPSRPLSPYSTYPELKPPSSPTPSRP